MSEGQQRIENIFKKLLTDKKEKFESYEGINEDIMDKLKFLRGSVFNYIKVSCPTQTKWLEKHGEITFDDKGISVKIYENIGNEADGIIQEFDICAQMNDLGLKDFFDEMNSKKSSLFSNNQSCLTRCVYLEKDKTDRDVYNCFENCFENSFSESDAMFDLINKKISEVRMNLNV
jgi:hypothetical protein